MGAVQILTHSMVQSIEENSVRKGFDPRDFALVAEGGAGPLFAAQIAVEVGTPNVVVPPFPGVTAAMGLLATDMVYEYVATSYQRLSALDARLARGALRGARGGGPTPARGGRDSGRPPRCPARRRRPLRRPGVRAAGRGRLRRDRRGLGGEAPRRLPRHPRAGVLAPLRGVRHRDPQHPRARDRPHAAAGGRRGRARRRGAARRAPCATRDGVVPGAGGAAAGRDEVLRPPLPAGGQPPPGPAIVHQYDSTTVVPPGSPPRSTATATSSSRPAPPPRPRPATPPKQWRPRCL